MLTSRSLKLHKNNATSTIQSFNLKKVYRESSHTKCVFIVMLIGYTIYNQHNKALEILFFTTQSSTQKWTEKKAICEQ